MALTDDDIDRIEARRQASTPGPWIAHVEGRDFVGGSSMIRTAKQDLELFNGTADDYDFVAHAHQDIPDLIAEIRRLRGQ